MNYKFDSHGWYEGSSSDLAVRSTTVAPSNASVNNTEGLGRSNWNGFIWIVAPYKVPDAVVVEPPKTKRVLTKLQYINLFTDEELAAIYTAAETVVQVKIWLDKFRLADEIDRNDEQTAAGLADMVAAGLLAPNRPDEILA